MSAREVPRGGSLHAPDTAAFLTARLLETFREQPPGSVRLLSSSCIKTLFVWTGLLRCLLGVWNCPKPVCKCSISAACVSHGSAEALHHVVGFRLCLQVISWWVPLRAGVILMRMASCLHLNNYELMNIATAPRPWPALYPKELSGARDPGENVLLPTPPPES